MMRFLLPLLAVVMLATAVPAQQIFRTPADKEQDVKIETNAAQIQNLKQQLDSAQVLLRGSVHDSRRLDDLSEQVAEIKQLLTRRDSLSATLTAAPAPAATTASTQPPPASSTQVVYAATEGACAMPEAACSQPAYALPAGGCGMEYATSAAANCVQMAGAGCSQQAATGCGSSATMAAAGAGCASGVGGESTGWYPGKWLLGR